MGINKFLCISFILTALAGRGLAYLEYDGWILVELHHALDLKHPDSFSLRGNISIPSLNSGLANVVQNELTNSELTNLKKLAEQDDFYRLKASVTYPSGVKKSFLTSSKASSLIKSRLNDVLWVSIDGFGFVTAITQTASTDVYGSELDSEAFQTDVLIRHSELAPVPDTASFIQKVEREREARERGDVRDNRGFFAKYWMYIVPVVLLVFISGATNQEQPK